MRQQFKLNFFERPSDQKRAAKKEEGRGGSASWSGSQEALSVGSVGTHTEGHAAAARARSIYSAGRIGVNRMPSFLFILDKVEIADQQRHVLSHH